MISMNAIYECAVWEWARGSQFGIGNADPLVWSPQETVPKVPGQEDARQHGRPRAAEGGQGRGQVARGVARPAFENEGRPLLQMMTLASAFSIHRRHLPSQFGSWVQLGRVPPQDWRKPSGDEVTPNVIDPTALTKSITVIITKWVGNPSRYQVTRCSQLKIKGRTRSLKDHGRVIKVRIHSSGLIFDNARSIGLLVLLRLLFSCRKHVS